MKSPNVEEQGKDRRSQVNEQSPDTISLTGIVDDPHSRCQALTAQRDSLLERLEDGYQKIEQRLVAGQDVANWEDFWVLLLHRYEQVCDDLRDLRHDLAA